MFYVILKLAVSRAILKSPKVITEGAHSFLDQQKSIQNLDLVRYDVWMATQERSVCVCFIVLLVVS